MGRTALCISKTFNKDLLYKSNIFIWSPTLAEIVLASGVPGWIKGSSNCESATNPMVYWRLGLTLLGWTCYVCSVFAHSLILTELYHES